MNSIPNIDVENTSTSVLLAFFNTHSGQPPVKRFADRASAIKRVKQLIAGTASAPQVEAAVNTNPVVEDKDMAKNKAKGKKAVAKNKAPKVPADRSKAVAKTWADPKVAKARAKHDRVMASGKEFRSVKAAFEELKLPLGQHITFRGALKKAGELVFTDKAGDRKVTFRIAKAKE